MQARRSLLTRMFAFVDVWSVSVETFRLEKQSVPLSDLHGLHGGRAYTSSRSQCQPTEQYISGVSAVSSDNAQTQRGLRAGTSR